MGSSQTAVSSDPPARHRDASTELLERIAAIRPTLAQYAAEGEQNRRVPAATIDALTRAGAFRVSVPQRYGGYELGHLSALEVGRAVALADGGAAWVVSLLNSGAWYTQLFPSAAQEDIFGADPDARVSAVVAPTGVARESEGGYRVSGEWTYNSGSWHATWALVAVSLEDAHGVHLGEGQVLVPASDYHIEDVWRVAGMRSSGSNLLVIDDVFVPSYRSLRVADSDPVQSDSSFRAASVPLALVGPQLGLGRAVLDAVLDGIPAKPIPYTAIRRRADSVPFQLAVAGAATRLDTADLFARRAAADLDSASAAGVPLGYRARARVRADVGWAVENVTEAIAQLLSAAGSAVFADTNPIQRFWRDQAVVARHGYVSPPFSYEVYGKALLGIENDRALML